MSNFLAVATVTAALQHLLQGSVGNDVSEAVVSTTRPNGVTDGPTSPPAVNIFLYHVDTNPALRNADAPTRSADGRLVRRPQAALDLYYLLSFYGDDTRLEPQRLLGATVRTLHARPVLTRDVIQAVVTAATAQPPMHPELRGTDLADQAELVRFTPHALNLEELSDLWSALFQTPYALSVAYRASVVLIEAQAEPGRVLPVLDPDLVVTTLRRPRIERVVSQAGPGGPIVATDTLAIQGGQLGGGDPVVRLLGADLTPSSARDDLVTLRLTELPAGALRAGPVPVRIVQRTAASRELVESNEAGFVLHPTIAEVRVTGSPATVTVRTDVRLGTDQGVLLLLLDPATGQRRHLFDTPGRDADTDTVDVPVPGVDPGVYAVQLHVDGAASRLERDDEGNLTPAVTL